MTTILIEPQGLEADAVVPQCLDNHYVSDSIFQKMIAQTLDYTDAEIARLREDDFRTEFIRSLIYSSQVVIQRAFLKNSHFLYKNFLPEDRANFQAFAKLIRDKSIVPFLFKESSLQDEHEFDLSKEGDRATKALLGELDDIICVRLAVDEHNNKKATDNMATAFGAGLTRLEFMKGPQRNALAAEVFSDRSRLDEEGAWEAFNSAVDGLVDYAIRKNRELRKDSKLLQRQHVYRDNFALGGNDSIVDGRFRKPDRDAPFLFELKKYVDLVYNVNLPDHLKRYTFTPMNMPSRMAMQDSAGINFTHEQVSGIVSNKDALEAMRRTFMAHTQKAMSLPLLKDLSVADVHEIRALPQWEPFKTCQANILKDPLRCLGRIEEFQQAFADFQLALSQWYNKKRNRKKTEKMYYNYISLALNLGGRIIVAGSDLGPIEKAGGTFLVDNAVKQIPDKITSYAAKLMINVYDLGEKKLDAQRSYSIELMQSDVELMKEDIVELLRSINAQTADALPPASEHLADQGIL